ncbi:MAG TPA: flagellar biosynthesis protein FlhF [Bacillota bacterium]
MRVKRYVADSLHEAIARVKLDLGRNAIILHTKQFKEGGFLGFFARRRYEVIAALDENQLPVIVKTESPPVVKSGETVSAAAVNSKDKKDKRQQITNSDSGTATGRHRRPPGQRQKRKAEATVKPAGPEVKMPSGTELDSIHKELTEMKELLRQVTPHPVALPRQRVSENKVVARLREQLNRLGLEPPVIEDLIKAGTTELTSEADFSAWLNYCKQLLAAKLMFSEPLKTGPDTKQQIIALIGPTGVGKTTTIAKLAAKISLFEKKKVGLVTIDTYRIAAVEHLKTYAEIMSLPVEVVYTPADLETAFANLSDYDVILIDTAGRSPRNQAMMEELRKFIAAPEIETILLVISATTQYRDMLNIEQKFSRIAYTHLVFTKLDETGSLGPLVSLAWNCKRPISYLTTGQSVPDDIEVAKPDRLITDLFKELVHD